MKKSILLACATFCLSLGSLLAGPKGMGYDVFYPVMVSDPDSIADEGAWGISWLGGFGGDRSSHTLDLNYQLGRRKPDGNFSLNFLFFQYDWTKGIANSTASELQVGLYYTKSIFKEKNSSDPWRPAEWNLATYFGVSYAASKLEVVVDNPLNLFPQVFELENLRGGTNGQVKGSSIPLIWGLVGTYTLTPKHGVEVFGNVDYHYELQDSAFDSSYTFNLNLGANYNYRLSETGFFPSELSFGVVLNSLQNDIEDGIGMGLNMGFRKRF
jgi:hypothetical protein